MRSENNLSTCSYSVPSPKLTSSIEHELASCFTNLSSHFLASGLLLNVGILLPGNSFSVALRMRVRLMNKKKLVGCSFKTVINAAVLILEARSIGWYLAVSKYPRKSKKINSLKNTTTYKLQVPWFPCANDQILNIYWSDLTQH